jgi:hypothetical protein
VRTSIPDHGRQPVSRNESTADTGWGRQNILTTHRAEHQPGPFFHTWPTTPYGGELHMIAEVGGERRGAGRLQEVDLGVVGLVVDEAVTGRAVPAGFDRGAAFGVARGLARVGVPRAPLGEEAEGPG